jgi:hypothetical protein
VLLHVFAAVVDVGVTIFLLLLLTIMNHCVLGKAFAKSVTKILRALVGYPIGNLIAISDINF